MRHAVIDAPLHRAAWAGPALLASLLIAGCGGGGNDAPDQAQASPMQAPPAALGVRLEGCVVTAERMASPDTPVQVRSADGRMIGTAFTDRRGVFVMTVPPRSAIVMATATDGSDGFALNTGNGSLSVAACLRSAL